MEDYPGPLPQNPESAPEISLGQIAVKQNDLAGILVFFIQAVYEVNTHSKWGFS